GRLHWSRPLPPVAHRLPTRRSSDLQPRQLEGRQGVAGLELQGLLQVVARRRLIAHAGPAQLGQTQQLAHACAAILEQGLVGVEQDRKSTRLNSSHVKISYAVFCLKK